MSYSNQHPPPPGQYGAYLLPQQGQQWGQPPPQGAYGGYPPAPPQSYPPYGSGYAPPHPGGYAPPLGAPIPPQGSYAPPPGAPTPPQGSYAPPPGAPTPPQGSYAPPPGAPAPPQGSYVPPSGPPIPPQGSYAPPAVPPAPQHPGYNPSYIAPPPPGQAYPPSTGVPPRQPYGASPAPPAAPYGYGAPPASQHPHGGYPSPDGPPMYLGVPIPPPPPAPPISGPLPGFDAYRAVETVRKAMKGFGTDEKALTGAIAPLDSFQVEALKRTFEATTGTGLIKAIEKETSSWYEHCLRAKVLGPVLYDCWLIHRACSGAGTHEEILTEILLDRTNREVQILKAAYHATYGRDLTTVIRSDLSGKTERLFNMALVGNRNEGEYVDQTQVQSDVHTLYKAGQGRVGTDEITICAILVSRSPAQLRALAHAYQQAHRRKLSKAIDGEFSGHMKKALKFVAQGVEGDGYGVHRDVELIEESMSGIGTKDERLIYRVIRAHWNRPRFEGIKQTFHQNYGKLLLTRVRGETSGDYRDFMSAIIGH